MATNYKSCPFKKRPITFIAEEVKTLQQKSVVCFEQMEALNLKKTSVDCKNNDQPQDLSLKRKASDSLEEYVASPKREYVLNLSNKSSPVSSLSLVSRVASPVSLPEDLSSSSVMLSPPCEVDCSMEYHLNDIHLRGLNTATNGYTNNPYKTAFVMAAGGGQMPGVWNTYQSNESAVFSSPPPSSTVTSYSFPAYNCQHITPPSSPRSEVNFEPEDLSIRSDIPLPALYHLFDEPSSNWSPNSSTSSLYSNSSSGFLPSPSIASKTSNASNKNYRFKCHKCNKMYSTSMGLSKHQQFHCPAAECNQEKKQHACQDCGKLYSTMGALKMHIRTHTLPCKCPICGKAFSRPWLLQGHIRTHTGEKPFRCTDCPRSFADRSNLRAHQQTHADVKKYACKVCDKSFSRMSLLNKHASSNCTITIV